MIAKRALLLPVLMLLSCVAPSSEEGTSFGMEVLNLTGSGPQSGLPPEVDTLRILVMEGDTILQEYSKSLRGISDLDGNGESDRELAVEIPPDRSIDISLHAKQANTLLATAYIRDVEVNNGGRRYVSAAFTKTNEVYGTEQVAPGSPPTLDQLPSGRFGHATALVISDGRALITGGFTVGTATTCPPALATSAICFQLQATNEALLVDTSDFSIIPTRAPMLRARALHTATSLGDGRILIAGGVSSAILGLERVEGVLGGFEYHPHIVTTAGFEATARTFEIFDPALNAEDTDVGHDGDPDAGGFIGNPADAGSPGQMNAPRYLHGATLVPGLDDEVLVVGGQGSAEASVSAELFQLDRAGGSGFLYPPTLMADTSVQRIWPAVATTDTNALVIGGAYPPTTKNQLLERWQPSEPPAAGGLFTPLSSCPGWDIQDRPSHALVGATAVTFGRVSERVLVTGWLGPLCNEPSEGLPATQESYSGTVACSPTTYSSRSFTVGTVDCSFGRLQNPEEAHLLGPPASMPTGEALIAGGFSDGKLNVTRVVELLTGEFSADSNLAVMDNRSYTMARGRAWFTATTLSSGRVLLVGGMNFVYGTDPDVPQGIDTSTGVEIFDPGWDPAEAATSDTGQ